MIDSAIAKTHGFLDSYATWTEKNPGKFFGTAAMKCAVVSAVVTLYEQYKDRYGDSIQTDRHTSIKKRVAEDVGWSLASTVATFGLAKVYVKHPNWHPKSKENLGREPEGAERASEEGVKEPVTSRESRSLAERMTPRSEARSTMAMRT